jgi:hypothetical protein
MAGVIAMSGKPVKMAENALFMLHNPAGLAMGDAEDMRGMADMLDRVRASLLTAYERKTRLGSARLTEMLDAETWLTAEEARTLGFVDEVTEPIKIAARFDKAKFRNCPSHYSQAIQAMNPLRTSILAQLELTETAETPITDEQILGAFTARLGSLTTERDTVAAQFADLTATATQLRTDLTAATAQVAALTTNLAASNANLTNAQVNIGRLEALCKVKGISASAAVPVLGEPHGGNETPFEKWIAASGAEKQALWRAHKSEIRAEALRRQIAA